MLWLICYCDFKVPRVAQKMARVLRMLEDGCGFELIRGLPVERFSKADAYRIYWGIGGMPVGNFYNEGYGVKIDYVEAVSWYKLAAAQGNVGAQQKLGVIY